MNLVNIAAALEVSVTQLFSYVDEEEKYTDSELDLVEIVKT